MYTIVKILLYRYGEVKVSEKRLANTMILNDLGSA